MTRRVAALALAVAAAMPACGEKEERVVGPSRGEVRALVAEGLEAVGAKAVPAGLRFRADGAVLRVRLGAPVAGGLPLASFDGVRAELRPFCPKPALLRCRPALRASAWPRSRRAASRSVAALRRLAVRTYDGRVLVRRRGRITRVVTANGELLAAVRTGRGGLTLAFGGLAAPRRPRQARAGRLELEAGPAALAAARRDLSPAALRALAGVRRLIVSAPL